MMLPDQMVDLAEEIIDRMSGEASSRPSRRPRSVRRRRDDDAPRKIRVFSSSRRQCHGWIDLRAGAPLLPLLSRLQHHMRLRCLLAKRGSAHQKQKNRTASPDTSDIA